MSQRYLGGVITANPTTPTLASLSGVWTLEQQFQNFNVWSPEIVGNSVRIRGSAYAYFNRTPSSATDRRTWTWSGWVKRGTLGNAVNMLLTAGPWTNSNQLTWFGFKTDNTFGVEAGVFGISTEFAGATTAVFRDPSAWYHIVVAFDSTQATSANRVKVYVNGTLYGLSAYPSQNYQAAVNNNVGHRLGNQPLGGASGENFDGYLGEINFVDGQALTPSSFGAYDSTGVWQPLPYTGTYGTNGYYLTFADNSAITATTIGKDYSGNGNNWSPNFISGTSGPTYDWMLDSPTNWTAGTGNGVANYCVLNPIFNPNGTVVTYSAANLQYSYSTPTGVANRATVQGSFALSSGKWYFEFTEGSPSNAQVGISSGVLFGGNANGANYVLYYSGSWNASSATTPAAPASFTNGDVIGVAFDVDNRTAQFFKNGVSQGTITAFESGLSWYPVVSVVTSGSGGAGTLNFGQRPFSYTPPTGFKALNTLNLPTPNIMRGSQYMDINLWTGDQAARTITNSGLMQPDFLWTKSRSNAEDHRLSDSVRGGNGTVLGTLASNTAGAEAFDTDVTGFTSTGFNIRAGTNSPNVTGRTYVGWQWQAGKGVTSSNTNGSITSTVSVNTTAGFSVVSYTGNGSASATVGHGLGVAPAMVIVKSRGSTASWIVKHKNLSSNNVLFLEATNAQLSPSNGYVQDLSSSTTFGIVNGGGGVANVNTSSTAYIAYCFAAVTGYSAFGSYTGNGSTDGPFVYLGFRPRYFLWKPSSTTGSWAVYDSARNTYNVEKDGLWPNLSNAETDFGSTYYVDFLSNGFKIRGSGGGFNGSGETIIYACFAENPFNISRAR
jgi:hypothetical protein